MDEIKWYLKQLLPLKYETTYVEGGDRKYETWRMWFGRCFNIRTVFLPPLCLSVDHVMKKWAKEK